MGEEVTHHHVCLPSNCSNFLYENKASNFRVKLARDLKLEGKWEVALTQIIYPHNWYNITNPTIATFFIICKEVLSSSTDNIIDEKILEYLPYFKKEWETTKFKIVKVDLIKGYFTSPTELGKYIVRQFRKVCSQKKLHFRLRFEFDVISQRSLFTIREGGSVTFNNTEIASSLGLFTNFEVYGAPVHTSPFETPFDAKPLLLYQTPALYVLCDCIQFQLVGDSQVPLLRVVSATGKHGDIVEREFAKLYYIPVSKGYISTIEIQISDDTGEKIAFESGKLVCMLHFRKCGVTF